MEITKEIKQKVMVAAQGFFRDEKDNEDYPHTDVSGQYDEFIELLKKDQLSLDFINTCYEMNK